ncbi:hypothetical protein K435DRAFT_608940, partial [Dendrothele bispora CBS 962.96]
METRHATDESHTGEWIKNLAMKWIGDIGPHRFAASCSDNTGNTLLARRLIQEKVPTILSVADCCHHLDNTNKDIIKLKHFQEIISIVRGTIKSFSQSHVGQAELQQARKDQETGAGLESIGKTRFVTVVLSAMSLQRSLPAIRQVVNNGNFQFEHSEYFPVESERTMESFNFEFGLKQLIQVCSPIAKALTCLEANDTSLADVWIFWHAVAFDIERTIKVTKNKFPLDVQKSILSILNYRHKQLFEPDGRLYNPAYLAAAFLNPGYLKSDLFRDADIDHWNPANPTTLQQLE